MRVVVIFAFPFKPRKWTSFASWQCCKVSSDLWALKSVEITDIFLVMTSLSSRWRWNDIHKAAIFVVEQAVVVLRAAVRCTTHFLHKKNANFGPFYIHVTYVPELLSCFISESNNLTASAAQSLALSLNSSRLLWILLTNK